VSLARGVAPLFSPDGPRSGAAAADPDGAGDWIEASVEVARQAGVRCRRNEPLARHTTMRVGGPADVLAAPVALGLAFQQLGALLAGSGYGTECGARWAVTYTHPLAKLWSGAPLGVPLHPVQAYAALAFLALSIFLFFWLPYRGQPGELAGLLLLGAGVIVFFTEFYRDSVGRGMLLGGALNGPQAVAVGLVVVGGIVLLEHQTAVES